MIPGDSPPDDKPQHSFFYTGVIILVAIFLCNLLLTIVFSVFDFYNFDYSNFYSVVIFYIFILSCVLVLPSTMPGEDTGLSHITSAATSYMTTMAHTASSYWVIHSPPDAHQEEISTGVYAPKDSSSSSVPIAQPVS